MSGPPHIFGCTSADLIDAARQHGIARDTALRFYRDFYRSGDTAGLHPAPTIRNLACTRREADTIKFTLDHGDDRAAESVIIGYRRRDGSSRNTLCVSSQIGCAMGCTFCQTAQLGLLKNLDARDIVEQWYIARHRFGQAIDNIVYMGMGEPMENLDAVLRSIEILTDRNGAAIAPARITVSTVGRTAGIERLAAFADRDGFRGLKLAVSINAPNDAIRSRIMPINRAEPMHALRAAMTAWPRRILIEYVVIPDVNDALEHADELADYLQPLRCTVNVIPYNPRRDSPWPAPDDALVESFAARLTGRGLFVTRRRTTGRDIAGACGQLGTAATGPARRRPVFLTAGAAAKARPF